MLKEVLSAIPHVLPRLTDVLVKHVLSLMQDTQGIEDITFVGVYLIEGTSVEDRYHQNVKNYLLGRGEELSLLCEEVW